MREYFIKKNAATDTRRVSVLKYNSNAPLGCKHVCFIIKKARGLRTKFDNVANDNNVANGGANRLVDAKLKYDSR